MGHLKKVYHCKHGQQVTEYYNTRRQPPGEKRRAKEKQTPEKVKDNNQRLKAARAQRLMLNNFDEGDKYITLTYQQGEKKTMQDVQKDCRRLFAHIGKYYKEVPLMWIRNIERTKRGIYHIHLLLKDTPAADIGKIVREYWKKKHGKIVKVEDTYLDGGFEKLAGYMAKTERDEEGKIISSFSHSRNLKDVEPTIVDYSRMSTRSKGAWREIRVPKGYELVKESVYEGVNEITGFPYRRYTLLKQEGGKYARTSIRGD